jgi:type II secretory pathway pseudopilin PulG
MVIIAIVAISGAIFAVRLSQDIQNRRPDQLRTQTLWLARSAILSGVSGVKTVDTPLGPARVVVRPEGAGSVAEVELGGARAVVRTEPWTERYDAASRAGVSPPVEPASLERATVAPARVP